MSESSLDTHSAVEEAAKIAMSSLFSLKLKSKYDLVCQKLNNWWKNGLLATSFEKFYLICQNYLKYFSWFVECQ